LIPVSLSLHGFLSYKGPVEVDFTQFDLACISGSNGAGKSSILDAFTWVLFGQARKNDDEALINQGSDRATVSLIFEYEGQQYRVTRTKQRGKSALLELNIKDPEGSWKTHTEATLRDTDKSIRDILRLDYDTFINASFFLQGKADEFARRTPTDRKKVLFSVLGLDIWEEYRLKVHDRAGEVNQQIRLHEAQREAYDQEIAREDEFKQDLKTRQAEHQLLLDQITAKTLVLDGLKREETSLANTKQLLERRNGELASMKEKLKKYSADLDKAKDTKAGYELVLENKTLIESEFGELAEIKDQLKRMDIRGDKFNQLDRQRLTLQNERTIARTTLLGEQSKLADQEKQYQQDSTMLPGLLSRIDGLQQDLHKLTDELSGKAKLAGSIDELRQKSSDTGTLIGIRKESLNTERQRLERLNNAKGGECPVCQKPLSAEDKAAHIAESSQRIESLSRELSALQRTYNDHTSEINDLLIKQKRFDNLQEESNQKRTEIAKAEAQSQEIQARMEGFSVAARSRLAEIRQLLAQDDYESEKKQKLDELEAEIAALGYDAETHRSIKDRLANAAETEKRMRDLDNAEVAIASADREITTLRGVIAAEQSSIGSINNEIAALNESLQREESLAAEKNILERDIFDLRTTERTKNAQVITAENNLKNLDNSREYRETIQTKIDENKKLFSQLKTLDTAFGKNGVPAMLIEEMLPELESQANSILSRLSNGTMSLRFDTQVDYKTKREDKRDTLEIRIDDEVGSREYAMFSGGEAFRINFALRLALSKVLAHRAGARLQTLFIDEGFGSQDEEGRQRLVEAIKLIREEFSKILVITHLESLKDAFPARLDVEKTTAGSKVQVVLQ